MMRYLIILGITFFFYSCSEESADELFKPLPNPTIESLVKQGYERVNGIDVLMYSKNIRDTIYDYQFGNELSLEAQIWRVRNLSITNFKEYELVLKNLDFIPITPILLDGSVAAISLEYHCTYICQWFPEGELFITYNHPAY